MDYIWGTSIVETCLPMMIDLWEIKKSNKTTKKRKEKAAISVKEEQYNHNNIKKKYLTNQI